MGRGGGGAVRSGEHCRTLWASFHLSEMEKAPEGWVLNDCCVENTLHREQTGSYCSH